jgi:hypothetical protein
MDWFKSIDAPDDPDSQTSTGHRAVVAATVAGSIMVLETHSEYLDYVLDGGGWFEVDCKFIDEIGHPPECRGVWVLEFAIDGSRYDDPRSGHTEYEHWAKPIEWRRPTPDEHEAIIMGRNILSELDDEEE